MQNALDISGETGGKDKHGVGSIVSASSMSVSELGCRQLFAGVDVYPPVVGLNGKLFASAIDAANNVIAI